MQTIHFKTVDPVGQDLLYRASQKKMELNWERYERQQPQDGFLRLGLCCPYGCMQGPCRIDPYGRGADRGICGLDRDAMAAAFLLRLTLQGVMETLHAYPAVHRDAEIPWTPPLDRKAAVALKQFGGGPLSTGEILDSAAMLTRPWATPEAIVHQALRLSVLGIGAAEQGRRANRSSGAVGFRCGYGLLASEAILIGVAGRVPQAIAQALLNETAGLKNPSVQLLALGDWILADDGFLPIACTSGEMETVLSSGKFSLLLAGPQADPGLLQLCERLQIPVLYSDDRLEATEVLNQARAAFGKRSPVSFDLDPNLVSEGRVCFGDEEIEAVLTDVPSAEIVLLGGSDTLFQTLGHIPLELAKALQGNTHKVLSWGDAALWITRQGLSAGILEAREGPLAAVGVMVGTEKMSDLKEICFIGLRDCRDFALALGLAALGLKVSVAVPLPLWGSTKLRAMLKETLDAVGGVLNHFDHHAQADEILEGFLLS